MTLSVVRDPIKLNKDLDKVGLWVNKGKMSFNPDPSKQAQEVIFFTENNQGRLTQKHSGIHLDEKLTFQHINEKINKANKRIGIY